MPRSKPDYATQPVANDWGSQRHAHALVLIAATTAGMYLCLRIAAPFMHVITWSLAFAIMLVPVQRWLETKIKPRGLAAGISVLLVIVAVTAIVLFLGRPLVTEVTKAVAMIKQKIESGEWQQMIAAYPRLAPLAQWAMQQDELPAFAGKAAGWITGTAGLFLRGSLIQIVSMVVVCYILFFLLRDRREALGLLTKLSPLSTREKDQIIEGIEDTVHATLYGTLVVAAIQGTLGGLMFWILGLPAPLLWGIVMAVMAAIPVLGTFIVWAPAVIVLALQGDWGKALLLTAWGGIAVSGIDNILYPILVGRQLKVHTLFTFFSLIGGLFLFGGSGLILGPVTLTMTKILLEIWHARNERSATAMRAIESPRAEPA